MGKELERILNKKIKKLEARITKIETLLKNTVKLGIKYYKDEMEGN